MRILIITEEDEHYIPLSIQYILVNCPYTIVGVVCVKNRRQQSKLQTARKFYTIFGLSPVLAHALRLAKAKLLNTITCLNFTGRYFSVKRLCEVNKVPYSHCENVNSSQFLQFCREVGVELIAAVSPSQIFKEELINLPEHGCINIHTAKLPKYRGLYPTYWAMSSGEKTVGISIHYIEKEIDTGKIILQDEVEIPSHTTLDHMLTVTKLKGAELLVRAIAQIAECKVQAFYPEGKGSYFSLPTKDSYKKFKGYGYKLW
ncbi:MAG: methionyl-tRNA formyltransferase [Planctomycetota bacterium]